MWPDPTMRDWRAVFGKNVRRYRQQRKLTQDQLVFTNALGDLITEAAGDDQK